MSFKPQTAIDAYKKAGVHGGIEDATPHQLIKLLFEGALLKIAGAKQSMLNEEVAQKGEQIGSAISIVQGLQASLDIKAGGEMAENLDALYDYMQRRLIEANLNNDSGMLDEVSGLILEIKTAWDAIAPAKAAANAPSAETTSVSEDTPALATNGVVTGNSGISQYNSVQKV